MELIGSVRICLSALPKKKNKTSSVSSTIHCAVTTRRWDDLLFYGNGGCIVALCQYLGLLPLEKTIRPLRYLHIGKPLI